jgi:hypothetical protein
MVSSLVIGEKVPHDQSLHAISCVNYLDWMEYINVPWKNKRKQKKSLSLSPSLPPSPSPPPSPLLEHLMLETRQPWKSIALNWVIGLRRYTKFVASKTQHTVSSS